MNAIGATTCADRLRRIDERLWCRGSYFVVWGLRGSVRMTVIETSAGLLLYSRGRGRALHLDRAIVRSRANGSSWITVPAYQGTAVGALSGSAL